MQELICPDCGNIMERDEESKIAQCTNCPRCLDICPQCDKLLPDDRPMRGWENCPHCGKSLVKTECPICKQMIFADQDQCPKCKTKFTVCLCPECGNRVIAHKSLEVCPICETYYEYRCQHCDAPHGFGVDEKNCTGCGRFL